MLSEGASRRLHQVGAPERASCPLNLAPASAPLGGVARVNAHQALDRKSADIAAEAPSKKLSAQAITAQPKTMRRRPPRSLPRARVTAAMSQSRMPLYRARDRKQASRAVGLRTCDRLGNKCPPTGFCKPLAPPHRVAPILLTQSRCHTYPAFAVSKKGSSSRRCGKGRPAFAGLDPTTFPANRLCLMSPALPQSGGVRA